MSLKDCTALLNIFCHHITSERNNSCMTDNIIIVYSNISSSAPDINKNHSGFLLICSKDSIRRSQRFKDHILNCKVSFSDTLFDILGCSHLAYNNMKVSFKTFATHADRVLYTGLVVDNKTL